MVSDEKFFAWLDGELNSEEMRAVEAEVARDPELKQRAEAHRAMEGRLRGAFAGIAERPVPAGIAALAADQKVASIAGARDRQLARSGMPVWQQAAAMAATLALGIFVGGNLGGEASAPVAYGGGQLVAAAALDDALTVQLASAPADHGPRIGMSFRNQEGEICRTFTDSDASGLACRSGDDWRIEGLFQVPEGQSSDYRMAAGPDPRLMELADAIMVGEPLDGPSEAKAKERGWR